MIPSITTTAAATNVAWKDCVLIANKQLINYCLYITYDFSVAGWGRCVGATDRRYTKWITATIRLMIYSIFSLLLLSIIVYKEVYWNSSVKSCYQYILYMQGVIGIFCRDFYTTKVTGLSVHVHLLFASIYNTRKRVQSQNDVLFLWS